MALAFSVEHPQRQDARARRHPGHQTGHMGAVAVAGLAGLRGLGRVGIAVDEVPARQQPARQGRMGEIDAGVEHRHRDATAAGRGLRAGQADGCTGPLRRIRLGAADGPDIVLDRFGAAAAQVGLGHQHPGLGRECRRHGGDIGPHRRPQPVDGPRAEPADQAEVVLLLQCGQPVWAAQHQHQFTRNRTGRRAGQRRQRRRHRQHAGRHGLPPARRARHGGNGKCRLGVVWVHGGSGSVATHRGSGCAADTSHPRKQVVLQETAKPAC